jgi:LysM repeat protein
VVVPAVQIHPRVGDLPPACPRRTIGIPTRQVYLDAGGRWTPWSTFTSGSYRRFLDRARQATGGGPDVHLPNGTVHVVRAGETLSGIARANGVTLEQLRTWNPRLFDAAHHGGNLIQVGEAVALSAPGSSGHAGQTFVVRTSDTLASIASAHGLTLDQLRARNPVLFDAAHHAGNLIHPGELVRL